MKFQDLKMHYKSNYDFSKQTGLSRESWRNWEKKGYIPIASQIRIEKESNGLLKANVADTCEGNRRPSYEKAVVLAKRERKAENFVRLDDYIKGNKLSEIDTLLVNCLMDLKNEVI